MSPLLWLWGLKSHLLLSVRREGDSKIKACYRFATLSRSRLRTRHIGPGPSGSDSSVGLVALLECGEDRCGHPPPALLSLAFCCARTLTHGSCRTPLRPSHASRMHIVLEQSPIRPIRRQPGEAYTYPWLLTSSQLFVCAASRCGMNIVQAIKCHTKIHKETIY